MPTELPLSGALSAPVFPWAALLVGLVVGSFANVCIHRLPRGQSVVTPPSTCPACGVPIRPRHNLPVVGYLWLKGRCASCRAPIPPRYPAVEAANGLAWLGLAVLRGPTADALVAMSLVTALLVLSLIDLEHQILPNAITLPGIAVGVGASLLPGPPGPIESVASAAGGYLGLAAVARMAEWHYQEEALGQGDWKLVAMLGAFLGWQRMLLTLLLGCLAGAAVGVVLMVALRRSRRTRIPLGTFLGAAGIAVVFAGDALLSWYRGLLGA